MCLRRDVPQDLEITHSIIVSHEVLITQRQINCFSIIFDNYAVGLSVA